jgi:hypothetical protein
MTEIEQRIRELHEVLLLRVARCTSDPADVPAIQGGIEELVEIADSCRAALHAIAAGSWGALLERAYPGHREGAVVLSVPVDAEIRRLAAAALHGEQP